MIKTNNISHQYKNQELIKLPDLLLEQGEEALVIGKVVVENLHYYIFWVDY